MKKAWGLLVKIFIVGQKYQMPNFRNDAIDGMLSFWNIEAIDVRVAPYIYANTLESSPLRRLLVIMAVMELSTEDLLLAKNTGANCAEFFFDLATKALQLQGNRRDYGASWEVITDLYDDFDLCLEFHTHSGSMAENCTSPKDLSMAEDDEYGEDQDDENL